MYGKAGVSGRRRPTRSACRLGRLLSLLALLPVFFLLVPPANAAFPGVNGKIALSRNVAGNEDIYTMNPDGTGLTRLTNDPAADSQPQWSPDGRRIAFISFRNSPGWSVYVMNADGSGQTRLAGGIEPHWSPDGKKIVFGTGPCYDGGDIYFVNQDGTGLSSFTPGCGPSWSPDGTEIAFSRYEPIGGYDQLFKINADGSGLVPLNDFGDHPDWSPDGQQIVFDDSVAMYKIGSGGGAYQQFSTSGSSPQSPAWSPDGSKIAFFQTVGGDADIWTMNPNGTNQVNVTNSPLVYEEVGSWQPIIYGYARPISATPTRLKFVPAFKPCTSSNGSHNAPLTAPSCSPPQQASDFLTVGTADSNGAATRAQGSALIRPICNPPAPGPIPPCTAAGDQGDAQLQVSFTDVRQKTTLLDYAGELQTKFTVRITDRYNGLCDGCPQPGTASDVPFSFAVPCTATPDTSIGSTCSVATTANSVLPGVVREGKRAVWELGRFELYDGGSDGDADTPGDNTLFAVQGLLAP
jgi:WD40 repeat protein